MPDLETVKRKVAAADAAQNTGGLLTRKVDAAARVMLTHKVNPNQPRQVVLMVDRSGSMSGFYRSGIVQQVIERVLGFAVLVDDDGKVPVVFYDDEMIVDEVSLDDFHGYVDRKGITARGGTDTAAAYRAAAEILGCSDVFRDTGSAPSKHKLTPSGLLINTGDGLPSSERATREAVRRMSYAGVFIKNLFVGTDRRGWKFLDELDKDLPVGVPFERGGRLVDNVNSQQCGDMKMSDEAFFQLMMKELSDWDVAARAEGVIA